MLKSVLRLGRRDTILLTASFVFLAGAAGFVTFYNAKAQAVDSVERSRRSFAAETSPQAHHQRFLRATELRKQWEPWAKENQRALKLAVAADKNDTAALWKLYETLPQHPRAVGITDVSQPPAAFTWQLLEKLRILGKQKRTSTAGLPPRRLDLARAKIKTDFALFKDVVISSSMNPGMKRYSLWASGRITESSYRKQSIPGQPALVENPPREIVPPYAFLGNN